MIMLFTSCEHVDNSVIYHVDCENVMEVNIYNNYKVQTKFNDKNYEIELDSSKLCFFENGFEKEYQFYNLKEKFTIVYLKNCEYPTINIKRRIRNGTTENALQTVVLGFKDDRYKLLGYQLNMIHLVIEDEYLILNANDQIVIKKDFKNEMESGIVIGTFKRNLIECDSVYLNNFNINLLKYKYLEDYLYSISNRAL